MMWNLQKHVLPSDQTITHCQTTDIKIDYTQEAILETSTEHLQRGNIWVHYELQKNVNQARLEVIDKLRENLFNDE